MSIQVPFSSVKDQIKKHFEQNMWLEYTLVEGFYNQPYSTELTDKLTISGSSIPMIAIINNETGRVAFYAVKAIIPDIEEKI